jgi:hypothetical protein
VEERTFLQDVGTAKKQVRVVTRLHVKMNGIRHFAAKGIQSAMFAKTASCKKKLYNIFLKILR